MSTASKLLFIFLILLYFLTPFYDLQGRSSTSPSKERIKQEYCEKLQSVVNQYWDIPPMSFYGKKRLVAKIRIFINEKGKIVKKNFFKSSSNDDFDNFSLIVLNRASSFLPPPPEEIKASVYKNGLIIQFERDFVKRRGLEGPESLPEYYGDYLNVLTRPNVKYFDRIKKKLKKAFDPAEPLKEIHKNGKLKQYKIETIVGVTVDQTGKFKDPVVLKSSGFDSYDNQAIETIKRIQFPKHPPQNLLDGKHSLRMAWTFTTYLEVKIKRINDTKIPEMEKNKKDQDQTRMKWERGL